MSNTRKKLKINLTTSNCSSLQPVVVDNFTGNEIPFHCHSETEWPTVDNSVVTNFARYLLISLTTFLQLAKYWYPYDISVLCCFFHLCLDSQLSCDMNLTFWWLEEGRCDLTIQKWHHTYVRKYGREKLFFFIF